jgi:hypothetical protein
MSVTPLKRYTKAELKRLATKEVWDSLRILDEEGYVTLDQTEDELDQLDSVINSLTNYLVKIQDRIHKDGVYR